MDERLRAFLKEEKIEYCAPVPLSCVTVIKPYLLEKCGVTQETGSALCVAVPYFTAKPENISAYACSRDYHLFFEAFFERLCPLLEEIYPGRQFFGFADRSPVGEVYAAAKAGLGVIGDNHLLLTEKYSSFVFLGEVISSLPAHEYGFPLYTGDAKTCLHCGACSKKCPEGLDIHHCLSALTQKKGTLTFDEEKKIADSGVAWGCDLCQNVCPYTRRAVDAGTVCTPLDFFQKERMEILDLDTLYGMSDEEFLCRAFSWRGKETIARNLRLFQRKPVTEKKPNEQDKTGG